MNRVKDVKKGDTIICQYSNLPDFEAGDQVEIYSVDPDGDLLVKDLNRMYSVRLNSHNDWVYCESGLLYKELDSKTNTPNYKDYKVAIFR